MTPANPYLKWPVLLDEYTRNREVWVCPSSRFEYGLTVMSSTSPAASGSASAR